MDPFRAPRPALWLPTLAAVAAAIMIGLAWSTARAVGDRHDLALDGEVLGLAHRAEIELREQGLSSAEPVLSRLLEVGSEVSWIALVTMAGETVAEVGVCAPGSATRNIEVALGRVAFGAHERGSGPQGAGPAGWTRGRGRLELRICLDPEADKPPMVSRLVVPASVAVSCLLFGLALLGARLLERQHRLDLELADRRRLEALGRAGAGLAHQLRTPLGTIKGSCQLVLERVADPSAARRLEVAVAEAERMERMLSLLLDFARPPQPEPVQVSLRDELARIVELNPGVTTETADNPTAWVDREHLQQMLGNLVENAIDAGDGSEKVTLVARTDGDHVYIDVTDRGVGPGDDPERLFEPYVTDRADGTGLGLPIARTLAEVNRGTVTLHSREGGGCVARVVLPKNGNAA